MRLVVDTNILVSELTRKRGRELIIHPSLELYIAQMAWEGTCHELGKRLEKMVRKEVFSQEAGQNLLSDAITLAETKLIIVPHEIYASWETIARLRIPRDPNDWFTAALALVLPAGIWTNDGDFLGCVPTWTTETLLSHLSLSN